MPGKRLSRVFAAVAAVIGVASGAVALYDWIDGKVAPPARPPPSTIDARISRVTLRSDRERLIDYMRETNQSTARLSSFQGAERGYVFIVRVRIEGNQARRVAVRWAIIDKSREPLRDPIYNQTAVVFVPRGPDQSRAWPLWTPYPETTGAYRLRVTLVDEKRRPLDEVDSKPFRFELS